MKHYTCKISTPSELTDRMIAVSTTSALKCAKVLGRCEPGEVFFVYHGDVMLSCARWDTQAQKYVRVQAFNDIKDLLPGVNQNAILADLGFARRVDMRYVSLDVVGGLKREMITWVEMFRRIGYGLPNLLRNGEPNHNADEPVLCIYAVCCNGAQVQLYLPDSWKEVK